MNKVQKFGEYHGMEKSIENANLALPYLVCYAKKGKTLTYKELAEKINSHL